jgi:cytosine permease
MTKTSDIDKLVEVDHVLGEEYEHEPVPISARRGNFSVATVWIGFPTIITGAMTGSILVLGMGFSNALLAMVIGNSSCSPMSALSACWERGAA